MKLLFLKPTYKNIFNLSIGFLVFFVLLICNVSQIKADQCLGSYNETWTTYSCPTVGGNGVCSASTTNQTYYCNWVGNSCQANVFHYASQCQDGISDVTNPGHTTCNISDQTVQIRTGNCYVVPSSTCNGDCNVTTCSTEGEVAGSGTCSNGKTCCIAGGGGGGTTCNGDCNVPQGSNCGVEGHVPGSGACGNGNLCCAAGPGPNPYTEQGAYVYCQDGSGPQYGLPGLHIQLQAYNPATGVPTQKYPSNTTALTTDANGRAYFGNPSSPVLPASAVASFASLFSDMPSYTWTTNTHPWAGTSQAGATIPATGQSYGNLTLGDTHNSIFENAYQPNPGPWLCPSNPYLNCNGWFAGGSTNTPFLPGGWATNSNSILPQAYFFQIASYGSGNYVMAFHFSHCTCDTPAVPASTTPANNGTATMVSGQVTVSWAAVAGATSYDLELFPAGKSCADPSSFCKYTASGTGLATNSFTFTPTANQYIFRVRAVTTCAYPIPGAWSGWVYFTIVGPITGTIYSDPALTAIWNAGTGLCTTGAGDTPQAPDAGSTITATWENGGTSTGTITGSTYNVPNVPFLDPNVNLVFGLPVSSIYHCSCPSTCNYTGSLGSQTANLFMSSAQKPWFQSSNGLLYGGTATGQAVSDQIPNTCVMPACTPAMSLQNAAKTVGSAGVVISGGGTIDSTAQSSTQYSYLSQDATTAHISSMSLNGPHEDYTYFSELYSMGLSPASDPFVLSNATKPTGAPVNGRAYYANGNMTIGTAWTVNSGESFVIFVNGDLTIQQSITVAEGGFLAFIVKGNVIFPNTVGTSGGTSINAAVGEQASQWQTYPGGNPGQAAAGNAVNGNTSGDWNANSISIADITTNPWWQVDMGASYSISSINVFGRTDSGGVYLATQSNNYHIFVSDNPFISGTLAGTQAQAGVSDYYVPGVGGSPNTTAINRTGRYVRIQKADTNYLSLGEVQVMGTGGNSAALNSLPAPVGWWKFDECTGTAAADASGNNNAGTISIGAGGTQASAGTCATANTAWGNGVSGKYGASLNFDGTDDVVSVANASGLNVTGPLTIAAWIKPTDFATYRGIISKGNTCGGTGLNCPYDVYLQPATGVITLVRGNASAFAAYRSSTGVTAGVWSHIVIVDNGATVSFYINGNLISSSPSTMVPTSNSDPLNIGLRSDSVTKMLGQIDNTQIYNTALTAAQVQTLYNNTAVPATSIQGVFVANGQIQVQGGLAGGDLPFSAQGTYVGWGGVLLQRIFSPQINNNTAPTETFMFRPDFVLNTPARMTHPIQLWQETN